jgi:hypothetical protein
MALSYHGSASVASPLRADDLHTFRIHSDPVVDAISGQNERLDKRHSSSVRSLG